MGTPAAPGPTAASSRGNSMANSRCRLLIVDDEPSIRELVSDILMSQGYDVLTAKMAWMP